MGIYQRQGTGIWYVRFNHRGRDYKKAVGTDKQIAQVIMSEIEHKIRMEQFNGLDSVVQIFSKKTFADAAGEYMAGRVNFKASTLVTYNDILKNYLLPEFGTTRLLEITESDVRKFQAELSKKSANKKELSNTRINNIMRLLSSVLAQAERDGAVKANPAKHVKSLSVQCDIDPFSDDEVNRALAHVEPYFRPLFMTLTYTGARPNEMLALRWKDIDWVNNKIYINKGRCLGKEGLPKTQSSIRDIPILPQVADALRQLKSSRKLASINDYVFIKKDGHPIDKHLDRIWSKALRSAGVRHRPAYNLRHSFATRALMKGIPIAFIAQLLGHVNAGTTLRHYARWVGSIAHEDHFRTAMG